ncbi:MAG: hypothetical protein R3B72_04360 [Polyangiaceae bacterium]
MMAVLRKLGLSLTFLLACGGSDELTGTGGGGATSGSGGDGATSSSTGGTTSSSSGSGGAGGLGAGGAAPVDCASGDYLLCEDFEADQAGSAPGNPVWEMVQSNGATLVVDDQRAHGGSRSIHLVTPSGPTINYLRTSDVFPAADEGMYGRLHYYVKGPNPEPSGVIHADIVQTSGPDPVYDNTLIHIRYGFIYNKFSDVLHYLWNYEKQPRPPGFNEIGVDDQGPDRNVESDQWHCLAWRHDRAAAESQLWHDGEERTDMHVAGMVNGEPVPHPIFDRISIGWTLYQSFVNGPYEVWIDDIVLDDAPIACDVP